MNDKIALVTGASRGFGFALAEALAKSGWHVVALARTVGGLEDLDDRIKAVGGDATLVPLDITDDAGLQRMCLALFERWGHVDLFVHSAIYVGPLSLAGHVPESDWEKMVAANIHATGRMVQMLDPLLKVAANGCAILPTDDAVVGKSYLSAYGASKAAQKAIWDSWAAETRTLRTPKIRTFAPNPMPTALRGRFYPGEDRTHLSPTRHEAARLLASL